jgi:hypothetical protein
MTTAELRVGCMPNYKPSSYRNDVTWIAHSVKRLGYDMTSVDMTDRVLKIGFPAGVGHFYLLQSVQTSFEAHQASYSMGSMGPFPEGKAAGS